LWLKVSPIQKQHAVAIDILARLGLDNIKLEPEGNGRYLYRAWNVPIVENNGSARIVKRGKVRMR
jgi:hypothetical protein